MGDSDYGAGAHVPLLLIESGFTCPEIRWLHRQTVDCLFRSLRELRDHGELEISESEIDLIGTAAAAFGNVTENKLDRTGIMMMSAIGDNCPRSAGDPPNQAAASLMSHITWVLQPGLVRYVDIASVDEIIIFEISKGIRAFREVISALRSRHFDVLINLQVYLKAGIITALSGTRRTFGIRSRARPP